MKRYFAALILTIFLVAGGFSAQAADYSKYGIEKDVPGIGSYESIDAKD